MNFKFEIGQKKESGLIFILAERLFIDNTVLSQSHLSLIDYCQPSPSPKPKGSIDSWAEN